MTLSEIKQAVESGKTVHWANTGYIVIPAGYDDFDGNPDYLIKCTMNNHCIGLTWADGKTLNGKEEEFFIAEATLKMSESEFDTLLTTHSNSPLALSTEQVKSIGFHVIRQLNDGTFLLFCHGDVVSENRDRNVLLKLAMERTIHA